MKQMDGGYRSFRYGETSKREVYMPGKSPVPRHLIQGERRAHVIASVLATLREGKVTLFENEGACRHGLRSGFCMDGHSWSRSDLEAEKIVAAALTKAGAKRPTWEEGQREITQSPDFCSWCQSPLDDSEAKPGQRFCSARCARTALEHMARKSNSYAGAVLRSAYRLITKEQAPLRECEHCEKNFRSDVPTARFCSKDCANAHRRLWEDRPCMECGTAFRPGSATQQYCSHSCHGIAVARDKRDEMADEIRECGCCGEIYQPTREDNIYCSPRCASTMANRAYRERLGRAAHQCSCRWCGDPFISKMPWAEFCSREHRHMATAVLKRRKPMPITPGAFDFAITVPWHGVRPKWLTPQRFDELLAA